MLLSLRPAFMARRRGVATGLLLSLGGLTARTYVPPAIAAPDQPIPAVAVAPSGDSIDATVGFTTAAFDLASTVGIAVPATAGLTTGSANLLSTSGVAVPATAGFTTGSGNLAATVGVRVPSTVGLTTSAANLAATGGVRVPTTMTLTAGSAELLAKVFDLLGGTKQGIVRRQEPEHRPAPKLAALDRYTNADLRHLYPEFAHLFPDQPPTVETPITPAIVAAAKDMGIDPALLLAMLAAFEEDF